MAAAGRDAPAADLVPPPWSLPPLCSHVFFLRKSPLSRLGRKRNGPNLACVFYGDQRAEIETAGKKTMNQTRKLGLLTKFLASKKNPSFGLNSVNPSRALLVLVECPCVATVFSFSYANTKHVKNHVEKDSHKIF
jgi:hypothetical protein